MTKETKTISRQEYLQVLGMFTVARKHYKLMREFETTINEMLGLDDASHVSDELYILDDGADLDKALQYAGIEVAESPATVETISQTP